MQRAFLTKTAFAALLVAAAPTAALAENNVSTFMQQTDSSMIGAYGPDWSGELTAAASAATGNSSSLDVGVFGRTGVRSGLLTHELFGGYTYARANDDTNVNEAYVGYQLNRDFGDGLWGLDNRTYGYALARGNFDQLGAYKHDYFAGVGLGYAVISQPNVRWSLEGGPGARYLKPRGGEGEVNLAARLGSRFDYRVNERVTFRNHTDSYLSSQDIYIVNDAHFRFGLTRNMDAQVGVRVDYHTNPPAGLKSTDTSTYAGVTYRFGL